MGDTYFPEYDPTPYGGGLDLEELYGKPIVPSEKSCYAPSEPASSLADGEEDDKASVISAYGVELPDFEIDKRNSSPKGKQEEKGSAAEPWKPIYPAPEYHLRDSDLGQRKKTAYIPTMILPLQSMWPTKWLNGCFPAVTYECGEPSATLADKTLHIGTITSHTIGLTLNQAVN
ncbi:hypothetical protein SUGI_0744830 [Cryptomeria japonica]|nr:hypothetical protein SUGI_0744830 [Cryptomeria japonica]